MLSALKKNLVLISFAICSTLAAINVAAEEAPDFTLPTNSGENLRLSELRGNVVMLNFWASWCGPCRQEMPLLDAMSQRYSAAGFVLLGIDVEEDNTDAKKIVKNLKITYPILFDAENKVSKLYSVDTMPTTVMVDKKGKIRFINHGYKPGDENKYRDQIRELIKE
jgi:peroxiredoxin